MTAALLVLAVGCGDDGGTPTTTAAPTTTVADTTTVPPTTAAPTSTTPTPPTVDPGDDALPTDPADYAVSLVGVWEAGDRESALVFATPAAVDTIFAYESGGPGTWSLVGCEGAAGSTTCTFTAGGDPTVVVRVVNQVAAAGERQAVTEVQVSS